MKRYRYAYFALTAEQAKESVYFFNTDKVNLVEVDLNIKNFLTDVKNNPNSTMQCSQEDLAPLTYYVKIPARELNTVKEIKIDPIKKKLTVRLPIQFPIRKPIIIPDLSGPHSIDQAAVEDQKNMVGLIQDDNDTDEDEPDDDSVKTSHRELDKESYEDFVFTW